jgi:non-heme chloroperoxidase
MGPSAPHPVRSERNPTAMPLEGWHALLQGFRDDRVGFTRSALPGVFGVGAPESGGLGIEVALTKLEFFEDIVRMADARAVETCVGIITGTEVWEELARVEKKTLVLHGDGDYGECRLCTPFLCALPNFLMPYAARSTRREN